MTRGLLGPVRKFAGVRLIELAQHLVECSCQMPNLILALVVNAVTVVLRLADAVCQIFQSRQRSHDAPMRHECEQEAERCEAPHDDEAPVKPARQIVDALVQKTAEIGQSACPGRERVVRRAFPQRIERSAIERVRLGQALIHGAEIGGDARQHHRHHRFGAPAQCPALVAAIGGGQASGELLRGRSRDRGAGEEAGLTLGRHRHLRTAREVPNVAELGEQLGRLPHQDVLQVIAVEFGIEREIGIVANAQDQGLGLGQRLGDTGPLHVALRLVRLKPANRSRQRLFERSGSQNAP